MLTRWDDYERTFSWMDDFRQQLNRLFEGREPGRYWGAWDPRRTGTFPRTNFYDEGERVVFVAELPGVTEKNVNLSLQQDILSLTGELKNEVPEGYSTHRQERVPMRFSRSFTLPTLVDASKVDATLKDGLLTVRMDKAPEARPKQISVKAK